MAQLPIQHLANRIAEALNASALLASPKILARAERSMSHEELRASLVAALDRLSEAWDAVKATYQAAGSPTFRPVVDALLAMRASLAADAPLDSLGPQVRSCLMAFGFPEPVGGWEEFDLPEEPS